ncbi:MAG: hypothetical protein U0168_22980 [Nannocystaceae bacterium]
MAPIVRRRGCSRRSSLRLRSNDDRVIPTALAMFMGLVADRLAPAP